MTHTQALQLMRAAQAMLRSRRRCAKWIPGHPEICTRLVDHTEPCGRTQKATT